MTAVLPQRAAEDGVAAEGRTVKRGLVFKIQEEDTRFLGYWDPSRGEGSTPRCRGVAGQWAGMAPEEGAGEATSLLEAGGSSSGRGRVDVDAAWELGEVSLPCKEARSGDREEGWGCGEIGAGLKLGSSGGQCGGCNWALWPRI